MGREVRFWDVATGKPVGPRLTYHDTFGIPRRILFSPDGTTAALANEKWLWLVNVPDGKTTGPSFPPPGLLTHLSFSPDGKSLWVTTPASVRCLDVTTGRDASPGVAVRGRGFQGVIPGPDGHLLAVLDQSGVALWDTATGHRADFSASRSSNPGAVAFAPDGKGLLTADPSGLGAQLWDVALGKPVGLPVRCPSFFTGASFRPDGRALAVEGASGVVRLVRLPEPAAGDAAGLARRAPALTGLELNAAGDVRGLTAAAWRAEAGAAAGEAAAPALAWHLRRGLDRVEVADWGAALWHLDRRLAERPDDWLALALRARVLANLGRTDEAAADFDHSFEKGPAETVFAWHLLAAQGAATFDDSGDPLPGKPKRGPVAAWFLDRLLARNGREAVPLLTQRARARGRAGHWDRAIEDYERAARLAPDDAALLLALGRACARHGKPDRAAECFAKAAAASPKDPDLWLETADELTRLERWDQAAEHFLHAIDLQPEENGVAAPRAATCLELAHSPQAFDRAARAARTTPGC